VSVASSTAAPRPVLADALGGTRARDVALTVSFALVIALGAQVAVPLPVGPVPLTLQTLAVLLGAAALGGMRAVGGASLYVALGAVGVPWFAVSGGATAGYLVGFVAAAGLVGWLARRGGDRSISRAAGTMVLGNLVIYAIGVAGLVVVTGIGVPEAVGVGVIPFLLGDAAKVVVAAALLPAAWRLVGPGQNA
jgi:biotin transport system substrate-specific component